MTLNNDDLEQQLRKLGNILVPDTLLRNIETRLGHLTAETAERLYQRGKTSRSSMQGDRQRNLEMAIAHFQTALLAYSPETALLQHIAILYDIGDTYCELPEGDRLAHLETAVLYFKNALSIAREHDASSTWIATLEQAVGETYRTRIQELKHRASVSKAIGDVTFLYHDLDSAMDYYQLALRFYRMVESRLEEAIVLKAIGDVCHLQHQMTPALEYYIQSASIFGQIEDQYDEATVLKAIGDVFQASNQATEARKHYEQALDLFRQIDDRMAEATVLEAMGDQQEVKTALDLFQLVGETSMVRTAPNEVAPATGHFTTQDRTLPSTLPLTLDPTSSERQAPLPQPPLATPPIPKKTGSRRMRQLIITLEILFLASIVLGSLLVGELLGKSPAARLAPSGPCTTAPKQLPLSQHGIGVVGTTSGACIGVSDGQFAFDTTLPGRIDGSLKSLASTQLRDGNTNGAIQFWEEAISRDPADAEARIYLEDQTILATHRAYFTLVIGTILAQDYTTGRDDLQAAYLAQQAYNDQAMVTGRPLLHLLIAVAQSDPTSVETVAQQVVQAALWDRSITGVIGWPTSSSAYAATNVLGSADSLVKLPMVSPTASSDALTNISPYFFRINPTNAFQEQQAVRYVKDEIHATHVAILVDPNDQYSSSLANDFETNFVDATHHIVAFEQYTRTDAPSIQRAMADALSQHPDMIFFSGYASDVGTVLASLPACKKGASYCPLVIGGDALYLQSDYSLSPQAEANATRLRFTSFTFPSMLDTQTTSNALGAFLQDFAHTFDPKQQHPKNSYGYNMPEAHTMFSCDAIQVILYASNMLFAEGRTTFSADDLRNMLAQIDNTHPFQGLSWPIAFGSNGNDMNGQVVVLARNTNGNISQIWQSSTLSPNP